MKPADGRAGGISVYHVVRWLGEATLAGRVQRYSPIYYADSHANSALAGRVALSLSTGWSAVRSRRVCLYSLPFRTYIYVHILMVAYTRCTENGKVPRDNWSLIEELIESLTS